MRMPMLIALGMAVVASVTAEAAPATETRLKVSTRRPRPGDPVLVTVEGVAADRAPKGTAGKIDLIFFPVKRGWQAVFAVPLEDAPPTLKVAIDDPPLLETLTVEPRVWAEEKVDIAPEMAEPNAEKRKVIDADNQNILFAMKDPGPPRFRTRFARPGPGRTTSTFGAWRTLNGDYRSRHLGLDLGAAKGAKVRAIGGGKVTFVGEGFLTGQTVVVIHGAGIASTYFHLDDMKVAFGDVVERGTVLGKVGMSGRTTGPHIHVGVRVPGGFVDPEVFLKLPIGPPKPVPAARQ
jgi:murein DD-endopeptidase MepM/ murein hydrolase activator NlpD